MPLIATKGAASAQGFGEFAQTVSVKYIEDYFQTYLRTGTGASATVTTGLNASINKALVWTKSRSAATDHKLTDTVRGATKALISNSTGAETTDTNGLTAFSSTGYTIGTDTNYNNSGATYVDWEFVATAKFFDVVTYTGNGGSQTISHSLGSTPGCIIIKKLDSTTFNAGWAVYHRSLTNPSNYYLRLDTTDAQTNYGGSFISNVGTTSFDVNGASGFLGLNGSSYVAYLFAHDAGGFGLSGSDNVISCGSFDGTANTTVTLGYEPQWIMFKNTTNTSNWQIIDNMRGMPVGSDDKQLMPNLSNAESDNGLTTITATGFVWLPSAASNTYIYIAIRRGPMKVPTSGTSVLGLNKYSETSDYQQITTGNLVDLGWQVLNGDGYKFFTRLVGAGYLNPASTAAANTSAATKFDYMDGFAPYYANSVGAFNPREVYGFRRAPGFFDVVCYTGTGANRTVTHNLGVVPELMIVKKRSAADAWIVYANNDNTDYLVLNTTAATVDDNTIWNDTSPTSSVFTVGTNDDVNGNTATFVAYLFATVAGVSKVGTYTGSGTTKQIDCGFTGGARLVLIKRTDSTGDWYVYDTARGIVSGNDPYLLLNSTAAEVTNTDYVDTYSAGFELSSTAPAGLNANGGTYIFLAIA